MLRSSLAPALALAVAAALTGCGESAHGDKKGARCPKPTSTSVVRAGTRPDATLLLTDLRVLRARCTDRVTFDFRGGRAGGYRVEYEPARDAKTEDGSGRKVTIAGSAFLVVRVEPAATADVTKDPLEVTFEPRRVSAGGARHVREVVKTGDFEAVLTWVIGLDARRPFRAGGAGSTLSVDIG